MSTEVSGRNHIRLLLQVLLIGSMLTNGATAQLPEERPQPPPEQSTTVEDEITPAPVKVDVNPVARDEEIADRIRSVLEATGWFVDPQVRVQEGVVFLGGRTETEELRKWAGDLARNTQDVVAIANRIEVIEPPIWDFGPAWEGLSLLWRDFVRSLPFVGFALLILALSLFAGMVTTRGMRLFLRERIRARLLRNVTALAAGAMVFLVGTYIVLRVSGLTQLALTIVGGTGLIGLAVGIAFRDITENFLASIFLSLQQPFRTGDMVEISGITGYVQQLNTRTTVLMTLDGNVAQIPNATVYKSNLRNYSTNCNRREDFVVGIGYEDSIGRAQEIALKVLVDHPAVLQDPAPSVLADNMGASTVDLRVYFWLNGKEHSWLKVRSSVIRLIKLAFQNEGISMPDEAREVIFPKGVTVNVVDASQVHDREQTPIERRQTQPPGEDPDAVSTKAEAGLYSEAVVIEEQARQAQPATEGENLLRAPGNTTDSGRQENTTTK